MYAVRRDGTSRRRRYKRRSFFVDEVAIRRARKALRVTTDAEAVRASLERVSEMDRFWRFMKRTRGTLKPGSFRLP
jgi:hypothetical protein